MRTASPSPSTANSGPKDVNVVEPRTKARRGPRPATIAIAVLVAAIAFGAMIASLLGFWPLELSPSVSVPPTPVSAYVLGMQVEKVGEPRLEGDQVFVKVRVTNNVRVPDVVTGTPIPNAPTPPPVPADLMNGTVKVIFYSGPSNDARREIVGSAIGNVTDLKYGESKEIEVVGTGVGRFCPWCYEVFADTIWTDKDVVKTTDTPTP